MDLKNKISSLLDQGYKRKYIQTILNISNDTWTSYKPSRVITKSYKKSDTHLIEAIEKLKAQFKSKDEIIKELNISDYKYRKLNKKEKVHEPISEIITGKDYDERFFRYDKCKWFWINEQNNKCYLNIEDEIKQDNGRLKIFMLKRSVQMWHEYWLVNNEHSLNFEIEPFFMRAGEVHNLPVAHDCVLNLKFRFFTRVLYLKKLRQQYKSKREIKFPTIANRNDIISFEEVYYRVLRYEESSFGSLTEAYDLRPFIKTDYQETYDIRWDILVSFDAETCKFRTEDEHYNKLQHPYLLCATIDYNYPYYHEVRTENFFWLDLTRPSTVGKQFVEWLVGIMASFHDNIAYWTRIKLFGYNNNKFDNHFIIEEFQKLGRCVINERNGKVTEGNIQVGKWTIELYDMVKWVPDMSLDDACEDYDIDAKKLKLNILSYNRACEMNREILLKCSEDVFKQFLKPGVTVREKLSLRKKYFMDGVYNVWDYVVEYCKYDTLSVLELYKKISAVVKSIIIQFQDSNEVFLKSTHFSQYPSPANLSGHLFKMIAKHQNQLKLTIKNFDLGRFIFESYFGGRVDFSFLGEYISVNKSLCLMDVTSEYPLAMMGQYPFIESHDDIDYGSNINIQFYQNLIDKAYEERWAAFEAKTLDNFVYFRHLENWRGIFRANCYPPEDKVHLNTFAAIPRHHQVEKKIAYSNEKFLNVTINSVQCKNLILSGFKIEILNHEHNIFFTRVGYVFKSYVEKLGEIKYKAKENSNKTQAKLVKLFLNSIAGKMAQRPIDRTVLYESDISLASGKIHYSNNKFLNENWENSLHYLATFITAEANFILFSTMYRLQLEYIYANKPLSERTGSILYMDTDSIIFDKELVSKNFVFNISEELGYYEAEKCDFYITWKEKYTNDAGVDRIICLAKKSYAICKGEEIVELKLKGIHKKIMDSEFRNYEVLKKIASGIKKEISFNSLENARIDISSNQDYISIQDSNITIFGLFKHNNSNYKKAPFKELFDADIKKTLQRETNFTSIETTNKTVFEMNKHNLECVDNNFLIFCVSLY